MRAVLGNVEDLRRDYPGFEAPPVEYREGLRPGDLAELMLLSDQMPPEGAWAEVEEVVGPGWYRGLLDSGERVEFGPEHVSDIKVSGPQMSGVFDFFHSSGDPSSKKKPSAWDWEALEIWGQKREEPPIWDWGARENWVKEEADRKAKEPKRSFWDIFRRRPKVELTPIPPGEFRRPGPPRGMLPGPVDVWKEEEAEAAEPPAIVVPPAPPAAASPGVIVVPPPDDPEEVIIEHDAPINFFDILEPAPSAPPEAPSEGGLIASEPPETDPFEVPVEGTSYWDILSPEQAEPREVAAVPGALVLPERAGLVPAEESGVFEIIAASPEGALTPFDVLGPAPGGMVVSQPPDVFDVLAPEEETGLTPYEAPGASSPFDVIAPEPELYPTPGGQVEAPRKKKKKKARLVMSIRSSVEDWKEWILRIFSPLENVWGFIRSNREDAWFKSRYADEDNTGLRATIGIHTWENGNWVDMARYLDIPYEEIEPYVAAKEKEEEKTGDSMDAYDKFFDAVIQPVSDHIEEAFRSMQPADIKGTFYLGDDDLMEGQTYGIIYYEPMSKKERARILKEQEFEKGRKREEQEELTREEKIGQKARKREVAKIWGRFPTEKELLEELIPWAKWMYGEDFWRDMKKNRKLRGFQEEVAEAGENGEPGVMEVYKIADNDDHLYGLLSQYFGIPPDIFKVYFRQGDFGKAQDLLWNELLSPYMVVASQAVNAIKPKSIPGFFEYAWDEGDNEFFLQYLEEAPEEKG